MRKAIVDEGTNSFSEVTAVNGHRGSDKTGNDTPYEPLFFEK
jgi:hypothetical protein